MTISFRAPPVNEEALRDTGMEIILGASHRDVKQATFFLQLLTGTDAKIGWLF